MLHLDGCHWLVRTTIGINLRPSGLVRTWTEDKYIGKNTRTGMKTCMWPSKLIK